VANAREANIHLLFFDFITQRNKMKVNDAIAIMNETNATDAQLVDAEKTFRDAGLKGLLNNIQTIIGQRNRAPVAQFAEAVLTDVAFDRIRNNDPAGLSAVAGALLLAKCDRVVAEYEAVHGRPEIDCDGVEKNLFETRFDDNGY
jgi:hypothetical protein